MSWYILFEGMTVTYEHNPSWKVQPPKIVKEEVEDDKKEEADEQDLTPAEKREILEQTCLTISLAEKKQYDKQNIFQIVVNTDKFEDVGKPFEYDLILKENHVLIWGQMVQKFNPSP